MSNTISFYLVVFNVPDIKCNIITREAINIEDLEEMKSNGSIIDYEINDTGVIVTKIK